MMLRSAKGVAQVVAHTLERGTCEENLNCSGQAPVRVMVVVMMTVMKSGSFIEINRHGKVSGVIIMGEHGG